MFQHTPQLIIKATTKPLDIQRACDSKKGAEFELFSDVYSLLLMLMAQHLRVFENVGHCHLKSVERTCFF